MNWYKGKWQQCMLMHLNRPVASIKRDGTCRIYDEQFMPYNLFLETEDTLDARVNNLSNFYYWCASRVLTLDRKYAKEILNSIGAGQAVTDRERAEIALSYHCLTMTDVFWVRPDGEQADYTKINLYEHSLSDAFVDVSLRGRGLTIQNAEMLLPEDSAGDISALGAAPKAWIRRENEFFLLKDGKEEEVQAELLASSIARCFDVRQVLYEPFEYDGQTVSSSRLMTSLDYSIVPMDHVEIYAANHEMDRHDLVQQVDAYGYFMMNIIDYLVGNTDRHWGNWGFLVDNRTNLPVSLFPLMDFNQSFRAYDRVEGSRCLTVSRPASQMDAAVAAVRAVGLNQIGDIKEEWFWDPLQWEMFTKRLAVLREAERENR